MNMCHQNNDPLHRCNDLHVRVASSVDGDFRSPSVPRDIAWTLVVVQAPGRNLPAGEDPNSLLQAQGHV